MLAFAAAAAVRRGEAPKVIYGTHGRLDRGLGEQQQPPNFEGLTTGPVGAVKETYWLRSGSLATAAVDRRCREQARRSGTFGPVRTAVAVRSSLPPRPDASEFPSTDVPQGHGSLPRLRLRIACQPR